MQAEDIETYLADLGQELQDMGQQQPVRLLLVGGAFMLTQFHNRIATKDVDVLLKDVDDSTTPIFLRLSRPLHEWLRVETACHSVGSMM